RNRSHWSTSKTPSYTKSVSWQHHPIKDAGDYAWCCNFHLKGIIRPATLIEISNSDLISYIDSIKEYEIENSKLININYIHLNYDFLNIHQNT
ncbi:hypothetical protein LXO35_23785, partial [Escherichia coli]|nr:hypothetical protein [Escherichia coli]MCE3891919.1 hypothetical protein [Escherichia coli]